MKKQRRAGLWLVGVLLLLAASACRIPPPEEGTVLKPTLDQLVAATAQLRIPAGWELVSEELIPPCNDLVAICPEVQRIYQVENDPDFQDDVLAFLAAAGMTAVGRTCDPPEDGCQVSGFKGNISVAATVTEIEGDTLTVSLRVN